MYVAPLFLNVGNTLRQLDTFIKELTDIDEVVQFGIVSEGDAADYALVWEWGNVRQTKAGPKTTWGVNPNGSGAWLTIQAPTGYIRINTPLYWAIVFREMDKVKFTGARDGSKIDAQIRKASIRISKKILKVIQDTVPIDKGDLRDSLKIFTEVSMSDGDDEEE